MVDVEAHMYGNELMPGPDTGCGNIQLPASVYFERVMIGSSMLIKRIDYGRSLYCGNDGVAVAGKEATGHRLCGRDLQAVRRSNHGPSAEKFLQILEASTA